MDLAAFQDAFAAALLADPDAPSPEPAVERLRRQPGFAVYRNTVLKGCIDALQANYPTVARLVGEEWFRAAAAVFARARLPSHPSLLIYGEGFAQFLAAFGPARELPYLAAVAQVDRLWTEAHVAADAPTLAADALARLAPPELAATALAIHPAARWCRSDAWPIHTLWSRHREPDVRADAFDWRGEGVLVTRPLGPVRVAPLSPGGVALLDAAASGASIADAAARALDAEPQLDFAFLIRHLLQSGAFRGLRTLAREEFR
jgi:hypothetical protein